MNLAFSEVIDKKPTYFVDKILSGLWLQFSRNDNKKLMAAWEVCVLGYLDKFDRKIIAQTYPKRHTIRNDKKGRWKAGNLIHFVIKQRTKNQLNLFQTE